MSARRANRGPSNQGGPGPRKTAALAVVPDPLEREMAMRDSVGLDGRPEQPGSRCVRTFLRRIGSRTDPAEQFPSAITARLQNEIEAAKAGAGFTVVRRFPARDARLTRIDQNHSVDPSIQLMLPADPARARASRYGWIRVGRRSGARARRIGGGCGGDSLLGRPEQEMAPVPMPDANLGLAKRSYHYRPDFCFESGGPQW